MYLCIILTGMLLLLMVYSCSVLLTTLQSWTVDLPVMICFQLWKLYLVFVKSDVFNKCLQVMYKKAWLYIVCVLYIVDYIPNHMCSVGGKIISPREIYNPGIILLWFCHLFLFIDIYNATIMSCYLNGNNFLFSNFSHFIICSFIIWIK